MTLAVVRSRAMSGMSAPCVFVEVHLSPGLPKFNIVGLAEKSVKESKDRVRSALLNSGFSFPARHIVVNLAPADLPKEGGRFDLPMALGILVASGQLAASVLEAFEVVGELGLSGEVRGITAVMPTAIAAQGAKHQLLFPACHANQVSLLDRVVAYPANHLIDAFDHLTQKRVMPALRLGGVEAACDETANALDCADILGQAQPKRALALAAAGGHSLLMTGPPGAGKTLLASRLPSILPPMTAEESIEVAAIYSLSSASGVDKKRSWQQRPFRAPHHTASSRAMVGGGSPPVPGEISLAHRGVLFLDELPEFTRATLEALREPLESGGITISRVSSRAYFPAQFQWIAAMNPCPCGYAGLHDGRCQCHVGQIQRYAGRISGPMRDRVDLQVTVMPQSATSLLQSHSRAPASAEIRQRVCDARAMQLSRTVTLNARLSSEDTVSHLHWTEEDRRYFIAAVEQLKLSARAYYRCLKLARTVADFESSERVTRQHIEEALGYRVSAGMSYAVAESAGP